MASDDSTQKQLQEDIPVTPEKLSTVELFLGHPEAFRHYRAVGGGLPSREKRRGLVLSGD